MVARRDFFAIRQSLPLLLLTCFFDDAFAFVSLSNQRRYHLRLHEHDPPVDSAHAKKAGGGIAVGGYGQDLTLFDPGSQGKLGDTGNLQERLQQGTSYSGGISQQPPTALQLDDCQAWLEDIGLPLNFAKPTKPVTATALGRMRLISNDAPGDIQHVVLKLPDGMHYVEGQSLSVIPPGVDAKTGKSHKPRLYSIASTRYGDLLDGSTVSLCVRRAEYVDPTTGLVDPTKAGVCSNYLCDLEPGTPVQVAGPVGKTMLLPDSSNADIIMVATGTGIAPFRAFLHRLYMENTVARHEFSGKAWLILGVPVTGGLLYPEELQAMIQSSGGSLEVTYAISREMQNAQGGKLYVQDVLAERAAELFARLDAGAIIYFCGLKGMMPGILEAMEQVATQQGLDWSNKLLEWKEKHQWHVEVY